MLRPLRRRSGLPARPAGSASFTAGPRRRRRTHLEPSHANARRLFERDIEGRVTTLNLLRLREDCPCSGTSHLPRRGRERWDDLMPHVAATAGPDGGRDPPRSLDPDASGPIEGGQSQTRPRSSCGLAEESRTDARRAANIPPRSMCDALHAPRGLLVTPGGKPWSTVDPAAATTPSDQQRGMLSPRRSPTRTRTVGSAVALAGVLSASIVLAKGSGLPRCGGGAGVAVARPGVRG